MLSKKTLFIGLLTLIYVGVIARLVDWHTLSLAMAKISKEAIALVLLLGIFANLVTYVRARAVIRVLGFSPGWKSVFLAYATGNITNLSLNVVGQSLTRAVVLSEAGVPSSVSVIATYIERILAAGVLFLFSLLALWYLFGAVTIDLEHGIGKMLLSMGGILLVTLAVSLTIFREQLSRYGKLVGRFFHFWEATLLTLTSHAAGIGAYLVLIQVIGGQGATIALVAALTIVLFVTSLPISFAGFGLRELSAASALGFVGIAPDVAVAAALIVGVLYFAVTGAFGLVGLGFVVRREAKFSTPPTSARPSVPVDDSIPQHWDETIIKVCAAACAVLLFFRLQFVVGANPTPVNVNAADIVVLAALSLVGLMMLADRLTSVLPSTLVVALAGFTAVIALGLLVSLSLHNLGNWAIYTRGLGWLLMLGYALLGAAVVKLGGERWRWLIAQSLVVAAATICALQLTLLFWTTYVSVLPEYVIYPVLQGFANNQNAFCFDLAMVGIVLVAMRNRGLFVNQPWLYVVVIALIATTIYFTGSRTGLVALVLLAAFDWFTAFYMSERQPTPGPTATICVAGAAVIAAVLLHTTVPEHIVALLGGPDGALIRSLQPLQSVRLLGLVHAEADVERWDTIVRGMELWTERPVFGAGVGALVESLRRTGQSAIGIHSIYVWFLAEMGVVGLLTLLACGATFLRQGVALVRDGMSTVHRGTALVGIVAFLAISGLVQDFFFQRIFWFLLGLLAAAPSMIKSTTEHGTTSDRVLLWLVVGMGLFVVLLCF